MSVTVTAGDFRAVALWATSAAETDRGLRTPNLECVAIGCYDAPYFRRDWTKDVHDGINVEGTDRYRAQWGTALRVRDPFDSPETWRVTVDAKALAAVVKAWPKRSLSNRVDIGYHGGVVTIHPHWTEPSELAVTIHDLPKLWNSTPQSETTGDTDVMFDVENLYQVVRGAKAMGTNGILHHRVVASNKPILTRVGHRLDRGWVASGLIMPVRINTPWAMDQ